MSGRALLLFTKPAIAGRVKTRLVAGGVSAEAAAIVQAAFLVDLVERFSAADLSLLPWWALEAGESVPEWPPNGSRQPEGDLGARLAHAFRASAEAVPDLRFAAAIGTDCPDLTVATVDRAFAALEQGVDLAIVPAEDGGYALIAVRPDAVPRRLFDEIPWSGPRVLETTLARAAELGLSTKLLEPARDVDTIADLRALAERLALADPGFCRATREALAAIGISMPEASACAS